MADQQAKVEWAPEEFRSNWSVAPQSWLSNGRGGGGTCKSPRPAWRRQALDLLAHPKCVLRADGSVFLTSTTVAYRHICRGVMEYLPHLRDQAAALFAATLEPAGEDLAAWEAGEYAEQGAYIETFAGQSPTAAAITPDDVFRLADEMGLP